MKRRYKTIIGIVVLCVVLASIVGVIFSRESDQELLEKQLTEEDFLETDGQKIVNQNGDEILLRGTNLGGWLIQEYWMCPVAGDSNIEQWSNSETLTVLENRFGKEQTQELIETYQDNWITEKDIKQLAQVGCNIIRIPFWYRNFMSDADGTWLTENLDDNPGIKRLDWVIETARQYRIYVILDMHGCPGGQSYNHSTGAARTCELFSNTHYQDVMEELWVAIAERYKDNPAVAAYDIMNEAQEYSGEIGSDPRNQIYDRMIKAIREVDSRHMITIEGIWGLEVLPDPRDMNWENVIYQVHYYNVEDEDTVEYLCSALNEYRKNYNIPVYLGEFSYMGFAKACEEMKIHYSTWTYKGSVDMDGTWFMYYKYLPLVDVYNDSYDQIKEKWGECLRTDYFTEDTNITGCFQ